MLHKKEPAVIYCIIGPFPFVTHSVHPLQFSYSLAPLPIIRA